jgi:peroxiredoxin
MKRWLMILLISLTGALAQPPPPTTPAAIQQEINGLRSLPDDKRADVTHRLALQIRALTGPNDRLPLAVGLSNLATEGDFGRATLQEVATTLVEAIRDAHPQTSESYEELARLVHFEHVNASLDDPKFAAAMRQLEDNDRVRQQADFTLRDLRGSEWSLKKLSGKVVLVNFWATWCPPCRKEMPDLDEIYARFSKQGLVILALSDEEEATVRRFLAEHQFNYPILLDPGRRVHEQLRVRGIPQTLVYDRNGKLVAQAADMRTMGQFLEMLKTAGLQ